MTLMSVKLEFTHLLIADHIVPQKSMGRYRVSDSRIFFT